MKPSIGVNSNGLAGEFLKIAGFMDGLQKWKET